MALGSNFPCADTSSRDISWGRRVALQLRVRGGVVFVDESAVRDGNIIKARMPSVLLKFCLLVIEALS